MVKRRWFDKSGIGRLRQGSDEDTNQHGRRARIDHAHGAGDPRFRSSRDTVTIYGFHAVREALRSSRREIVDLYATEAAAVRLGLEAAARGLSAQVVTGEEIAARLGRDAVHQGVLLRARPLAPLAIADLPEAGLVLVLDQVTDPHNVGAMVRTAAAFGAHALVTTERHSPEFSGVLAKSASGGLEHVAIVTVTNLARALRELGDVGYLRVGLDSEAPSVLEATPMQTPLAVVLGAEGKGLRRLTRENCDVLARIELPGPIKSLNVSNACALAMRIVTTRIAAAAAESGEPRPAG